jgi:hypothetical protein
MKKLITTFAVLFLLFINVNYATNLRGLVRSYNGYNGLYYPTPNIEIYLYYWNGNQWVLGLRTYTDVYGMYYFNNVAPGYTYYVGTYFGQNFQISVTNVQVFDINPITL